MAPVNNNLIVAIELGSSKITGIAGQKNLDGSITVLSVVKEDATHCIRKGYVYNIEKTAQSLTNIINKLRTQLKREITQVYVCVGGQSIRSARNVINRDLNGEEMVTQEMITRLMDQNRGMNYQEQEILDAATQEYKVDNQYNLDPVGVKASHIQGNFLNILCRKTIYDNLNSCFQKSGIAIADLYLAPLVLADSVLTEAEKRSGCVLVDLGADTTTVAVYVKNILRHLAVIPLGGTNVTRDIASMQMEEKDAEQMKLQYASAYTENSDIDPSKVYPIDGERTVSSRIFIDIVESRMEEIIRNVVNQIPSEFADKLLGGIILTGGGSNMKNIERAFRKYTNVDRVRVAKFVNTNIKSSNADAVPHDGTMNTILALLAKGDMNCAGGVINQNQDLFDMGQTAEVGTAGPSTQTGSGTGRVMTAEEKKKIEEEARKKKEEEDRLKREEEERLAKEEEEKRKNRPLNKLGSKFMKFIKTMVSEEQE